MKKLESLKVKPSLLLQTQARRILRPEINSRMKSMQNTIISTTLPK